MDSEVSDLLHALQEGDLNLEEVARRFRQRRWPRPARPPAATAMDLARAEMEDPEPLLPGSFDEVTAAFHRGQLSDHQYDVLARAMADSKAAEDAET